MILDSLARRMKEEGRDVTVISALDNECGEKRSSDVLDILFRHRYKDLSISFLSIADLKKKLTAQSSIINLFRRFKSIFGRNSALSISTTTFTYPILYIYS